MTQDEKLEAAVQALLEEQKKGSSNPAPTPTQPKRPTPPPVQPKTTTPPPAQPKATTPPPAATTPKTSPTKAPIRAEELAPPEVKYDTRKSKGVAIVLGIFFGWLGVHDFYLKRYVWGVIKVIISMVPGGVTFAILWAIIDVIRIFRGSIDKDAKGEYLKPGF